MASCGRKLIILMCHPRCTSISSALWLLQADKVGACMCEHTGVHVPAIMCIRVGKYNDTFLHMCDYEAGDGILYVLYVHCIQAVTD